MSYLEKYRASGKLRELSWSRDLLYVFSAVHAGRTHGIAEFLMVRNEDMREVLDDEDYAEWSEKRAAALGEVE